VTVGDPVAIAAQQRSLAARGLLPLIGASLAPRPSLRRVDEARRRAATARRSLD